MKFAICLLAFVFSCQAISEEEALQKWSEYQDQFDKSYRSLVEHRHRFALFKQKLHEIEEHNQLYAEGKVSWYKGLTPFSDWTQEEFNSFVNKYEFEEPNSDEKIFDSTNLTVPASIDWRSRGAVSEVKDQGNCGSCWTFSSTGAMEGAVRMKYGVLMSLSEQNLLDCAGKEYSVHGCSGGTSIGAFSYAKDHGITTESAYPYTGVQGTCRNVRPVVYVKDFVRVPADENELLKAVGSVGPVSIAVFASPDLSDYKGGVFDDASCANLKGVNHGVLVVGYGSENGKDYWIIKNSWGVRWGEAGYWRMIRGKNSCNVIVQARYPLIV